MEKLRRHIIFYGAVQGVGFRYRAYHAANSLKNLWDGSVEMEAEGSEEAIDRMIMAAERGTFVRIENISAKTIPLQNDRSFQIL